MALTNKQYQQIQSCLQNTLEKTKAYIRRTNEIPSTETVFSWFQQMSEYKIVKDKSPIDASNIESNQFEAIFFFNNMRVHLQLEFENDEHRGHPYFNANFLFNFIDELDPDDYFDKQIIDYLKAKFHLNTN